MEFKKEMLNIYFFIVLPPEHFGEATQMFLLTSNSFGESLCLSYHVELQPSGHICTQILAKSRGMMITYFKVTKTSICIQSLAFIRHVSKIVQASVPSTLKQG